MWGRIGLLALVAGGLGGLYLGGFFELLAQPERLRGALHGLGLWAPLLYVAAFALLEPFFVPGIAFVITGAILFEFPVLFLLSWLGSIGAGVVGFGFARYLGRDFVARRLPPRLRARSERLGERGLRTVIAVRLTFFLMPPAHWLLGLSRVRFGTFVLGTAIGFLPGIALMTYLVAFLGTSLGDWLAARPAWTWLALAAAIGLWLVLRRRSVRVAAARGASG